MPPQVECEEGALGSTGWAASSLYVRLNQVDRETACRALAEWFHTVLVNFARPIDRPVIFEVPPGQRRPHDGLLVFLDPLLGG